MSSIKLDMPVAVLAAALNWLIVNRQITSTMKAVNINLTIDVGKRIRNIIRKKRQMQKAANVRNNLWGIPSTA
jgi:hypothetical protein